MGTVSASMSKYEHGFLEALYGAGHIGLALVDTDLRYVRVNDTLAEINGVSASEHEGRTVREVLPEFGEMLEGLLRQVIESRRPLIDLEISGPTPADPDADRHFRGGYFPIVEGDEIMGVAALVIEVTERVRSERELKAQASAIYGKVLQDLTVAQLALDQADTDKAYQAVQRGLAEAKEIASRILVDDFVPQA